MSSKRNYPTIKDLVFDIIHQTKGKIGYETVTKHVLEHFPQSKWKTTHWAWYKYQIKSGRFKDDFSAQEKENLKLRKAGNISIKIEPNKEEENHIKRIGDNILNHARMMIREIAKDDEDFEFKLNRWIYARLMSDERRKKAPVKQELWSMGMTSCQDCNREFKSIKGVEIHRKDTSRTYSIDNCELLCKSCHQKKR